MNTSVFVSAGIAGGVLLTCAALHITYLGMRAKRESEAMLRRARYPWWVLVIVDIFLVGFGFGGDFFRFGAGFRFGLWQFLCICSFCHSDAKRRDPYSHRTFCCTDVPNIRILYFYYSPYTWSHDSVYRACSFGVCLS